MSVREFKKSLNEDRVEGELVKTVFISLLTSAITFALLYYLKLNQVENIISKYGFFLFLSFLSYAILVPAVKQVRAYKEFPCMSGMMVGMTIGMVAGFLPGYFIGGTNGMFWGSVFGMAIGIYFGISNGKCCGVMGTMEGIMAGFMGGLMGAMTAVMLFADHLKISAIIIFIISAVILVKLNYLIYKEAKETERQRTESHTLTVILTIILMIITIWLMIFGPRSPLFS